MKALTLPLPCLVSICALLVWHPSSSQEKIIRVLFPGCTPQAKILDGLEKLKHLDFFKHSSVCLKDLEKPKGEKQPKRAESRESLKSSSKDLRPSSALQKDMLKKHELKVKPKSAVNVPPKDKTDGEEKPKIKDVDVKSKSLKPPEKPVPKKEALKEEKREVKKKDEKALVGVSKKEESTEKKKEAVRKETASAKPKKDINAEPKKDGKKDVKTEEKKMTKPAVKEVKKASVASGAASTAGREFKKGPGKTGSFQKKDILNKGTKSKSDLKEQGNPKEADHSKASTPEDTTDQFERLQLDDDDNGKKSQKAGTDLGSKKNQTSAVETPETFGGVEMDQKMDIAPSPLTKIPKSDLSVNFDLNPTAYQPVVGSQKNMPDDSEEKTMELVSPADSALNSAGHTPFHQSLDEDLLCLGENTSLGARGSSLGFEDYNEGGSCRTSDLSSLREDLENSMSTQDKISTIFKDLMPDSSTTMTSMPAEVCSPHSTEVDESLSVSSEQVVLSLVLPTKGSVTDGVFSNGHAVDLTDSLKCCGNGFEEHIHRMSELSSDIHHDVDLCLVSPCEFQHPRTPEKHQQHVSPEPSTGILPEISENNNYSINISQDQDSSQYPLAYSQETPPTSISESLPTATDSDVPPGSEDCPSVTADIDSDDESSGLILLSSNDPHPAPVKDLPPLPPQPGACMADAEADGVSKNLKSSTAKKKQPGLMQKVSAGTNAANSKSKASASTGSLKTTSNLDTKSSSRNSLGGSRIGAAKLQSSVSKAAGSAVYVDLAYLPSSHAASTVDVDFFRCIRSSYYIISGEEPVKEASLRSILDALLEGKSSWPDVQVTLIPTFDSLAMHQWYQETHDRQRALSVTVLGSNSTVAMQEETFPACKVEF